jgi:CRP-like cAMP-binding protein
MISHLKSISHFDVFYRFLETRVGSIPPPEKSWIESNGRFRNIEAGAHVLCGGEKQDRVSFNLAGLFKYYYVDLNGNEKTKYLCEENQFVFSITSFFDDSPAAFFIKALEDSQIISFPADLLRKRFADHAFWETVFNKIFRQILYTKEKREAELLMLNAEERFKKFAAENPVLINRVRQYELAAYLGIDRVHLSRIRAKIKRK